MIVQDSSLVKEMANIMWLVDGLNNIYLISTGQSTRVLLMDIQRHVLKEACHKPLVAQ